MQASAFTSLHGALPGKTAMPQINGRPDLDLAAALKKVSPQAQARAKSTATDLVSPITAALLAL